MQLDHTETKRTFRIPDLKEKLSKGKQAISELMRKSREKKQENLANQEREQDLWLMEEDICYIFDVARARGKDRGGSELITLLETGLIPLLDAVKNPRSDQQTEGNEDKAISLDTAKKIIHEKYLEVKYDDNAHPIYTEKGRTNPMLRAAFQQEVRSLQERSKPTIEVNPGQDLVPDYYRFLNIPTKMPHENDEVFLQRLRRGILFSKYELSTHRIQRQLGFDKLQLRVDPRAKEALAMQQIIEEAEETLLNDEKRAAYHEAHSKAFRYLWPHEKASQSESDHEQLDREVQQHAVERINRELGKLLDSDDLTLQHTARSVMSFLEQAPVSQEKHIFAVFCVDENNVLDQRFFAKEAADRISKIITDSGEAKISARSIESTNFERHRGEYVQVHNLGEVKNPVGRFIEIRIS